MTQSTLAEVDFNDINEAAKRIKGVAHKTPVLTCETVDKLASFHSNQERHLFFKAENFQKVGAFKFRGAFNAISQIPVSDHQKGVTTHSSGNHAQAIALAAKLHNIPATIVMPHTAPKAKSDAVKGYGATIVFCEANQKSRDEAAAKVVSETGATFIHPFENPHVMAGQGTLMLELLEQTEQENHVELDAVIIPVGGGGMISGCSIAAKAVNPKIRVFGAEPLAADDAKRSIDSQTRCGLESPPQTIADGLLTAIGQPNWTIIQRNVEDVFTVTEDEIIQAMKIVWERMKIVIEPSAAVSVAAVLFNKDFLKLQGIKNVGVVLSGGNLDLNKPLPWTVQPN
ncbi:pyridoxal-5'-phosphate-dependent enzyme, beta subunit, partial [Obelidium mucronatum]